MNVFERLAPFIQDYIYRNEWEELRANQVAACEVIFDTDNNLLLSSGTASGKTEAAFLPVLTELCLPFVRVGGEMIAMKAALADEEIAASENAIKLFRLEE